MEFFICNLKMEIDFSKYSISSPNTNSNSFDFPGKKHIALLYGGTSNERSVSLLSYEALEQAILNLGYKITSIDVHDDIESVLKKVNPDIVFNGLYGTFGEDGTLAAILNKLKIPYTHCGRASSELCFNKKLMKEVCIAYNINTAPYLIVSKEEKKIAPMPVPYVIKPISEGSSIGVEVIFDGDDFDFAQYKFDYGDEILVEKYIKGREMQVAVLNGKFIGILELKILKGRFYTYETKYTEGLAEHILPANISNEAYRFIKEESERIYLIFGCRSVVRLEFIYVDSEDKFYILEINTNPGFTKHSILPEIALYAGISYDNLVEDLILHAKYEEK